MSSITAQARAGTGGSPVRRLLPAPVLAAVLAVLLAATTDAQAGDILRGGATMDPSRRNAAARANSGAEAADLARRTAKDRLARTTRVVESLRRGSSATGGSSIPNGLVPGGLVVANPLDWVGANLPTQTGAIVNIVQTEATARLFWESFNVGRGTILKFDQSAGRDDTGKWIAFNHVLGSGESRIAGSILAPGQVYLENPNGIRFEAGARVEARTFVATTLPINTNLIQQGLLNNRDAQFLFSALDVPGGSDGTPAFIPPPPPAGTGRFGDIVVQAGALLSATGSGNGNGGRIMLVGANVENRGVIETPSGQAILAAGLQVGIQAHNSDDPSLRGIDVWVGSVGTYGGRLTNSGLIESRTGSITLVGREIQQLGALESSTTVNLNGRIDILASYGAVGNPNFDSVAGSNRPSFLNQFTGTVEFGGDSVTRILPDLASTRKIPGTSLPLNSQIHVEGVGIRMASGAVMMAPSGDITMRAGTWPFKDTDGDGLALNEAGLTQQFVNNAQRFLLSQGQIYFERGSLVDVSGSTSAFVPLSQHIVEVQMRGTELADSPLLRDSLIRGLSLVVDLRRSGIYGGREWIGSPLGDLTGLLNIIERDVAQLTARGGTITLSAGDSVVVASGATLDASGGFSTHAGGRVQTSRLVRGGRHLIDVHNATPDVLYDRVYTGQGVQVHEKWAITKTYAHPLAPLGAYTQRETIEGAPGGTISISAPAMVLDGELLGRTIKGPRQVENPPEGGTLRLAFRGERQLFTGPTTFFFLEHSPTPPSVRVTEERSRSSVPTYTLAGGEPAPLPAALRNQFALAASLYEESGGGFSHIEINNPDGDFSLPSGIRLRTPPAGSLSVSAKNVFLAGDLFAPGGSLSFTAYNFSPFLYEELSVTGALVGVPAPAVVPGRGIIEVAEGAVVSVAGMLVDDRPSASAAFLDGRVLDGGSVRLEGFSILLGTGSLVDASGGVWAKPSGGFQYGDGGSIAILSGKDPGIETSVGGELRMDGWLQAYSAETGGSLTIQSNLIQIGGSSAPEGALLITPEFFRRGGFSQYSLIGIGARDASGAFLPAIRLVSGTVLEPVTESWVHAPHAHFPSVLARTEDYLAGTRGAGERDALRRSLRRGIARHGFDDLEASVWEGGRGYGLRALGRDILSPFLKPVGFRKPASISLSATGYDDPFTENQVEALGIVVLEEGSRILTDPGAEVSVSGDLVGVYGEIHAPGGVIDIRGRSSFRLPPDIATSASFALPTVHIGPTARLSAAGTTVLLPDLFGRKSGIIYPGGTIRISGNIVAEAGAILDVSGTSAVLDFHPTRLAGLAQPLVPRNAGLNSTPWGLRTVPVRVDSDGGLIELNGGQFLYSDATLLGRAGGESALGGKLSVSSGRFYAAGSSRTGADINLIVQQTGNASTFGNVPALLGVMTSVLGSSTPEAALTTAFAGGLANPGIGFFAVEQFASGGFDALDLGFRFSPDANPIPFGGNIEFRGPVTIQARGPVRLAGGGIIRADSPVSITAPYVAVGQEFRAPLNPDDPFVPFREFVASNGTTPQFFLPPTSGAGSLSISARLIDVGTLTTLGIGRVALQADGGDIRGNGSLSVAGDILLRSAQVYPTTLATFDIFAYDPPGGTGSVTITQSGTRALPLSAGGRLRIFATEITQGGTLRAPLGAIALGWDGTDIDPSTPALDQPFNPTVGAAATVPTTNLLTLLPGSLTSVSAIDPLTGQEILIPFGVSPDGLRWIDPRGEDVTVSGLPTRGVSLAGNSVVMSAGATVDLRGGGDLLAYRWVPGTGGSVDLLGTASSAWSAGASYSAGDLVTFGGKTWSARVDIDPADFATVPRPSPSRYWTQLPEAFAIIPGFGSEFAPFNVFNTGPNSGSLAGDPGFVASGLRLGEQIYLEGAGGLAAGTYTLLPRRYGILPGAYLIIPSEGRLVGSAVPTSTFSPALRSTRSPIPTSMRDEGSYFVSGYSFNAFQRARVTPRLFSRFELVPPDVLANRAEYETFTASEFMAEAAARLDLDFLQRLPRDAAPFSIHGNTTLRLEGSVLAAAAASGRRSHIDISSFADIFVIGGTGSAPGGATAVLNSAILNSWGAGSLLIGGQRSQGADGTTSVQVRTNNLTLDNPGGVLSGADVVLVANRLLTMTAGSLLMASGAPAPTENLLIRGDGAVLRVSLDVNADVVRSGLTGSTLPLLTLGAGASLSGGSVIAESTYAADFDPSVLFTADTLTLGAGQISLLLTPQAVTGTLVSPHIELEGALLDQVEGSRRVRLISGGTFDIYGQGDFGSTSLEDLEIRAGGIRGFGGGLAGANFRAGSILLTNPNAVAPAAAPAVPGGNLAFVADTIRLGENAFRVDGYDSVGMTGLGGVIAEQAGRLDVDGALTITAPVIVGAQGATYRVVSTGALGLLAGGGPAVVQGGLGADLGFEGASLLVTTDLVLPSGALRLRARSGDLTVGGNLTVEGSARTFFDLVRYADAGLIELEADAGNVSLLAGSSVSVASHPDGGEAGTLSVTAPGGVFDADGVLDGSGTAGGVSGVFVLDAGSVASFSGLAASLDAAGFFEERNLRIRTGSLTVDGTTTARRYLLAADGGSITVTGSIDASGVQGGRIELVARDNLTLSPTAILNVAGQKFSAAGKGGQIVLEAGAAINGVADPAALLDIQAGSLIDLSVSNYVAGDYLTPGSSAFNGQFEGTLHLRAPRAGADIRVDAIDGTIVGGSAVVVEGFRVYQPAGGVMNTTLRNTINADNAAFIAAAEAGVRTKVLGALNVGLDPILVIAPGVEIINLTGDLTLGLANPFGSTNAQALAAADWDLSGWRYGTRSAPGILTLRARGDIVLNNTLSDGFTPIPSGSTTNFRDIGHSNMWLATLQTINPLLPVNTQSWSYRIASGADLGSAGFRGVLAPEVLESLHPGGGSLLVGEFYPAVPNPNTFGAAAAIGSNGQTADTIRISTNNSNRGTRFEVLRTGTGDIDISTGRDVQLRNPFATIYTAGVGFADRTRIFQAGDFSTPITVRTALQHPNQGGTLGAVQQNYEAAYAMSGGDVRVSARGNIGRFTMLNGDLIPDASRQIPTNWLYRRGQVDPATGLFAVGGVTTTGFGTITDPSASTTWWVDYSSFFQGFGALGGGNIELVASGDIINADAAIPTNARMAGIDPISGLNIAPDANLLLEHGGGDLLVRAGGNVDGGNFYIERGVGRIDAGSEVTTNQAQSPSRTIMGAGVLAGTTDFTDPLTWQAVTLYGGRSRFSVSARGNVLLGPTTAAFLLPQGLNNKFWYKTQFSNMGQDAGVDVTSFGGGITHRLAVTLPGDTIAIPTLEAAYRQATAVSPLAVGYYRPWTRLAETELSNFRTLATVGLPSLRSTAFDGDITVVGTLNLAPSPQGALELLASNGIVGLAQSGVTTTILDGSPVTVTAWVSASLNLSDADPSRLPGVTNPLGFQQVVGSGDLALVRDAPNDPFAGLAASFQETGSFTGVNSSIDVKGSLHAATPVHLLNPDPVRLYAGGGDITGLTLFSPKKVLAHAERDITDIAFYLQHVNGEDISIISAGRDIIPFNENSPLRSQASDIAQGNLIVDQGKDTVLKDASGNPISTKALSGDLQVGGPGFLEILAGRNVDLGTGANFVDGTGVGITSIGRLRNPFLAFDGAGLIVLAGVDGPSGGPALGLTGSSLNLEGFLGGDSSVGSTPEHEAIAALGNLFALLRQVGEEALETGDYSVGDAAIAEVFGDASSEGSLLTRARDIRTASGGQITIAAPRGGLTMASDIFGNPLTPPGIVTESGGEVSILTDGNVDIGQARIFTLRGGDLTIWSSSGDIAAGTAPKTVVTAPPTRVSIDATSADVQTDLGGLATGGGIGVLASVEGVEPGAVNLIAPRGTVDAGDAGIRATGNINIAAASVVNADNISAGGTSTGVPSAPPAASANVAGLSSGAASTAATSTAASEMAQQARPTPTPEEEPPSIIEVEVLGYGGGEE